MLLKEELQEAFLGTAGSAAGERSIILFGMYFKRKEVQRKHFTRTWVGSVVLLEHMPALTVMCAGLCP
jgi:hypothetical protein